MSRDRIQEAKNFAGSEVVSDLLDEIETKFVREWKNSDPAEPAIREHAWNMVQAVDALRMELKIMAQSGKINDWNRGLRGPST